MMPFSRRVPPPAAGNTTARVVPLLYPPTSIASFIPEHHQHSSSYSTMSVSSSSSSSQITHHASSSSSAVSESSSTSPSRNPIRTRHQPSVSDVAPWTIYEYELDPAPTTDPEQKKEKIRVVGRGGRGSRPRRTMLSSVPENPPIHPPPITESKPKLGARVMGRGGSGSKIRVTMKNAPPSVPPSRPMSPIRDPPSVIRMGGRGGAGSKPRPLIWKGKGKAKEESIMEVIHRRHRSLSPYALTSMTRSQEDDSASVVSSIQFAPPSPIPSKSKSTNDPGPSTSTPIQHYPTPPSISSLSSSTTTSGSISGTSALHSSFESVTSPATSSRWRKQESKLMRTLGEQKSVFGGIRPPTLTTPEDEDGRGRGRRLYSRRASMISLASHTSQPFIDSSYAESDAESTVSAMKFSDAPKPDEAPIVVEDFDENGSVLSELVFSNSPPIAMRKEEVEESFSDIECVNSVISQPSKPKRPSIEIQSDSATVSKRLDDELTLMREKGYVVLCGDGWKGYWNRSNLQDVIKVLRQL